MLHALLPAAALLTHNSAAKTEPKADCTASVPVAQAKDITQPTSAIDPWITDGKTYP
jgi:hypothetical protein